MLFGFLIFLLIILLVISLYLKFSYFPFRLFKRNGIIGPPPYFFYGNYKSIAKLGLAGFLEHQHQRYGSVVGFYWGIRPYVSVTDADLIKQITIKDFDNFMNRPKNLDIFRNRPGRTQGLFFDRDGLWRVGRQTLSPTFSSSKMKVVAPIVQNCAKTLVEIFREHADTDRSFEFFEIFKSFTMEAIFASAFGRAIDIQRNKSDKLKEATSAIFSSVRGNKKDSMARATMILNNFPWMAPIIQFMAKGSKPIKAFHVLTEAAINLIEQRRAEKEPGKYKDLLQLMIDSSVEESENSQQTSKRRPLTNEEITSHTVLFMLVGYETTANTLAYTSYLLALHPDIQEKLQEEIDTYFKDHPDTSFYQAAQDIGYLDMVIQESLRFYPPSPMFTRECGKDDYTYKDITIPKGTAVFISAMVLHKDPQYWEDPEEFNPLRFTAEEKAKRPQQCYLPFGAGPRNCIGMRFALLKAKIALIELLKEFTFVRAPDTEVPLETIIAVTMEPKNGIYLKVTSRK